MFRRLPIIAVAFSLFCINAYSQVYSLGSAPASIKWREINTGSFSVIYPSDMDSLARVYAGELEAVKSSVGNSSGYKPNQFYRKPMPVVLYNTPAYSNGVVSWAPRRAALFTINPPFGSDAVLSHRNMCIHESRHISQMQIGMDNSFRWARYILGDFSTGLLCGLYLNPSFLEGDAVVAETALTRGGRGRSADFLEYYRAAFASGDYRDFWKWRYGSIKKYTPDYYRIGYLMQAGVQTYFDFPDFSATYFHDLNSKFIRFWGYQKTVRKATGENFRRSFEMVRDSLTLSWEKEDWERRPFIPSERVQEVPKRYQEMLFPVVRGDRIICVRRGIDRTAELVEVDRGGTVRRLCAFASSTSPLCYDASRDRIWWSEERADVRWELASSSAICYFDGKRKRTLLAGTRYFNPSVCFDGRISVCGHSKDGAETLVVLDGDTGEEKNTFRLPPGMQISESQWVGGDLYFSAVTADGFGIYEASSMKCIKGAIRSKIRSLAEKDGKLLFVCDATGVNELYSLDPSDGRTECRTRTRFGIGDACFLGDSLYYTAPAAEDKSLRRCSEKALCLVESDLSQPSRFPMADKLSSMEKEMPSCDSVRTDWESRKYSKAGHLFRFHSWMPFYANVDALSSMSFESLSTAVGLGATAFFQNTLENATGEIAYHAKPGSPWRHSGLFKFKYSGLFPVFELSLEFNGRDRYEYFPQKTRKDKYYITNVRKDVTQSPSLIGNALVYIPFHFDSGGWKRGLIPQIRYSVSNDGFYSGLTHLLDNGSIVEFKGMDQGRFSAMQFAKISVRGYSMLPVSGACRYPRLGIGGELGYSFRPFITSYFAPSAYAYLYGYVPGVMRSHGIKLSAVAAAPLDNGAPFKEIAVDVLPRAISGVNVTAPLRTKFTFDYSLPFAPVDWSFLCPVAYIRNFELNPFCDACFYFTDRTYGYLISAGTELCVKLGNLLWLPYGARIGVQASYNTGTAKGDYQGMRWGVVFSMDI